MTEIVTVSMRHNMSDNEIVRTHIIGTRASSGYMFDRMTAHNLLNTILTALGDNDESVDTRIQSIHRTNVMHQFWFAITDYAESEMRLDAWRGNPRAPTNEVFSSVALVHLFPEWVFEYEEGVIPAPPKVQGNPDTIQIDGATYVRVEQP